MTDPFDDRHDDGRDAPVWDGQVPGNPDNGGTGTSGNTAPDKRD